MLAAFVLLAAAGFAGEPAATPVSEAAERATRPAAEARAPYAGRGLQDVLEELRGGGLGLIYSTDLVRPAMKVREEPKACEPRPLLEEVPSVAAEPR